MSASPELSADDSNPRNAELLLALEHGEPIEQIAELLAAGADANASAPLDDGVSRIPALYFPCNSNNVAVARLLLEHGANPNDGESVYHAAQNNHRECLALLVEHGADLSGRHEEYGNTPLYFLAGHTPHNPITPRVVLGMEWLLDHGADPNVPSTRTASGADVPGITELPLHRAAASGLGEGVARMLVEHGAVVDAPRGDGKTAYALAVRIGNSGFARYLASVGADTSRLTDIDRLLGACITADEPTARAIVAAQPAIISELTPEDRSTFGAALAMERTDAVRLMISLGWPLDDESEWGGTPLHWAAWTGRVAMARLLIESGAPINVRDSRHGSSPIAWAAHGSRFANHNADDDYIAIVNLLLAAGATRAESFNRFDESPESLATPPVAAVLQSANY